MAYSRGGEVLMDCKSSGWNVCFRQREAKEREKKEEEEDEEEDEEEEVWLLGFDGGTCRRSLGD